MNCGHSRLYVTDSVMRNLLIEPCPFCRISCLESALAQLLPGNFEELYCDECCGSEADCKEANGGKCCNWRESLNEARAALAGDNRSTAQTGAGASDRAHSTANPEGK